MTKKQSVGIEEVGALVHRLTLNKLHAEDQRRAVRKAMEGDRTTLPVIYGMLKNIVNEHPSPNARRVAQQMVNKIHQRGCQETETIEGAYAMPSVGKAVNDLFKRMGCSGIQVGSRRYKVK